MSSIECYLPAFLSGVLLVWALHYLCEYCQISDEILKSSLSANSDGCYHNLYPKGHNKHKCISVLTTYTVECHCYYRSLCMQLLFKWQHDCGLRCPELL